MGYSGCKLTLIFTLTVSLLSGTFSQAQEVEKGKIIRKIEIKGNKRIGSAAIKGAVRLKEGDPYSPEAVAQDVSSIWAMGFFDNVEVVLEDFEDGIKLTFQVTERPVIKAIIFEGNEELGSGKLEGVLELKERDYLKYYLVKLDEGKIKDLYLKKGFQFAEIRSELKRLDGEVELIYRIKEGPRATIKGISFKDNKSIESKKLLKQIKTRKRRFPTLIFKGVFDSDKFEEDEGRLKDYYIDKGWLDVQVKGELSYSPDRTDIYITFIIEEGERYYVGKITLKGNKLFSIADLLGGMELYEGGPFLPPVLEEDAKNVRLLYGEQGFINATVRAKRVFSPLEAKVEVTYEIEERERVYLEEIRIRGNEKTKDNVVRRELTFFPGERFDSVKIHNSHEKLMATGYFDMQSPLPVNMYGEPGSRPDRSNLVIETREGRTGLLRFGGGFGINSGLFGDISYSDKNFNILDPPKDSRDFVTGDAFRGAGHIFSLKLSPGLRRNEAVLSLTNPSIFDSVYSAGSSLFFFTRKRETWDEVRKGTRFSLGRMLTKTLSVAISPEFEDIGIQNVDFFAPALVKALRGSQKKLGTELRSIWDTRDNFTFPTKGHTVDGSLEGSVIDVDIVRFTAGAVKYYPIFDFPWWGKHVLSVKGSLGLVRSTTSEEVPIFERFFAGGSGSIRGFDFRGVSPIDPRTGQVVGGEAILLAGVEENFPIYKKFLRGVVFLDAGKVDEKDIKFDKMRAAVGAGFRVTLPLFGRMQIGVDFGIPVMKEPEDATKFFNINIGGPGGGN